MSIATRVAARFKSKKKTDKGTVYLYSERQVQHRNQEKAKRLEKLESSIKKLRSQVNRDLSAKDDQKRQTALAVALVDETFERIGNPESAKEGHFGVTGWQKKHVTFSGGTATITYVGKSGVKQKKTISEASLVSELKRAAEACANDTDTLLGETSASEVNAYLKPYDVTAKDLRGFHANRVMREKLQSARSGKLPSDKKERDKKLKAEWKKALEETAKAVGHEPSTLGSQYLVPGLEDDFMKDGVVNEPGSKTAGVATLDLKWVERMRKDFLTLVGNVPRIKNYADAHRVREGIRVYRKKFDDLFFDRFLNRDLKYDYAKYGFGEDYARYYDKALRTPAWDFVSELASMPIGFEDDYWSEERLFLRYQSEAPKWAARVKRKAQKFWRAMREALEDFQRREKQPTVQTLDVEQVVLEGFRVIVRGFDPSDDIDVRSLEVFKEGLKIYKRNAAARYPRLLKDQLPLVFDCEASLDVAGTYNHDGTITFYASGVINQTPERAAHILAHEMGHHQFQKVLSDKAQTFWRTAIRGDLGKIDLAELLAKWPGDAWAFEFTKVMADEDPVLALQVEAVGYGQHYRDLDRKEDFQRLLDSGQTELVVPKTPITGYANKNPEEAFCEAVGLLVAYGPRAVPERVRGWLNIILEGSVKLATRVVARYRAKTSLTHRVARRFIAKSFGDPRIYLEAMELALEREKEAIELLPWMRKGLKWVADNPGAEPPMSEGPFLYEAVEKLNRYGLYGYATRVPSLYARMHSAGGGFVFLALLQQLSFPDKRLRAKVERGAKFYNKTRAQRPDKKRALDVYEKAIDQYREHLDVIREAIRRGVPHGEGAAANTKIPAGPFTLINTGGFDDSTMDLIAKLAIKADKLLKQHGYGKVCYGDIHISNTVGRSPRILAFYAPGKDEMFVRANLKGKLDEALHTIIHELGHRYEFRRFVDRRQIVKIYQALKTKTLMSTPDPNDAPKPGETYKQRKKGKQITWVVSGTQYVSGSLRVNLHMEGEPQIMGHTSLEAWLQMTGVKSPAGAFVTAYAKKDPSENFAEMVAAHCLGTLPQEQVEMLEAII